MRLRLVDEIKRGGEILYDDGRPGHSGVKGVVLALDGRGMTIQFEDRADTNYIAFSDRRWMEFISVVG